MQRISLIIFILVFSTLSALSIDAWQNIRFSGLDSDSKIYVRSEINQTNLTENQILYKSGSQINSANFSLFNAANSTYQAHIPSGSGRVYYGLKRRQGSELAEVVPLRYTGSTLPAPGLLTKVSDSPVNNDIPSHCDIIADYITLSDTKLIVGLKNRGGGFPTSGGWLGPFYSYMVGVGDPAMDDPYAPGMVAWALHYINALGLYTNGLYKITGTSINDINRVAAIQTNIDSATNTLVMSSDLSTLMDDPDWQAFYDPADPKIGFLSMISEVTLSGGATQKDFSNGGFVSLTPLYVDTGNEDIGSVENLRMVNTASNMAFQAEYQRPDNRFNWGMSLRTEDGRTYNMTTTDPEIAATRTYKTTNLKLSHPEGTGFSARAWLETAPQSYTQSDWYYYNYVRRLNSPQNIEIQVSGNDIIINWDAVTTSFNGAAITVGRYIVEFAESPEAEFQFLGEIDGDDLSDRIEFMTAIDAVGPYGFFRVTAEVEVP